MKVIAFTALMVVALCARGSQTDYIAKTKRLDNYRVMIMCENGADPTGFELKPHTIVITCTYELPPNTVDCDPQMVNGVEVQHCTVGGGK